MNAFANDKLKAEIRRIADCYHKDIEDLTIGQLEYALEQAIKSGDFIRYVSTNGGAQAVVYVPFQEKQRLEAEIDRLTDELNRLKTEGKETK